MIELLGLKLKGTLAYLPFICMTHDGKAHLNTARVAEGLMIAAITATMTSYITIQTMKVELTIVKQEQAIVRSSIEDMKKDLYILKGKVDK